MKYACKSVGSLQFAVYPLSKGLPLGWVYSFRCERFFFKSFTSVLLCFLILQTAVIAQTEKTKEYTKEYSGKNYVHISHRYGPLTVKASQDGKVKVYAKISAKAKEESVLQTVFDQFSIDGKESGDKLDLNLKLKTRNWITVNGVTKVEFEDGTKVKGLKDLKTEFVVYVPSLKGLKLENKYNQIKIEPGLAGDLEVELHGGKLWAEDVKGRLDLNMKYSKVYLKNCGDSEMVLYDCGVELENIGSVKLKSKYSEIKFGNTKSLTLETYDDKIRTDAVDGNIEIINDKYSDFNFASFNDGKVVMYDGAITVGSAQNLQIDSKYSELKFKELASISFVNSYDDKLNVEKLGSLESGNSKYTDYNIGELKSGVSVPESYDDNVNIQSLASNFERIHINGKYTDLEIDMPSTTKYALDVNMKYGKVEYAEDRFDTSIHIEKNSMLELKGKMKGASENVGVIEIRGYDQKIRLK